MRKATACYAYKNKQSGQRLLVFWDKSGVPSDQNDTVRDVHDREGRLHRTGLGGH